MISLNAFARQRPIWIFMEMIAAIVVVGFIDYITGYEISFFIFYGPPIFAVAWYCDKRSALLSALIAGIVWWWADLLSGHLYELTWLNGWETGMRLGFFLFVAWVASMMKSHSDVAAGRIALLEHSQRLEREIIGISEREQRRIGQDLHDGLCQYLAALGCAATSLQADLAEMKLRRQAGAAGELAKLLQDAVVQTRDLARGLVPLLVDEAGLALALENLAASVTRLQGIRCTFETRGPAVGYEEKSAMHLYRIAQEAINNATKHGKARKISLSLDAADDVTSLRIVDDGTGIARNATSRNGMGLSIMNYRARVSGGELRIEESKNGGTAVSCIIHSARQREHEDAA